MKRYYLVVVLIALAQLAAVSEQYPVPLVCPLCGLPFDGMQLEAEDVVGIDSDFCSYGKSGAGRSFDVQYCTNCGYCDALDFFLSGQHLSKDQNNKARDIINTIFKGKKYADQEAPPVDLKFLAALECAKQRGADTLSIAHIAHVAAWSVRDKIVFRTLKAEYKTPIIAFAEFDSAVPTLSISEPRAFDKAFELLQLSVRLGMPASRRAISIKIIEAGYDLLKPTDMETLRTELDKFNTDCAQEARFLTQAASLFEDHLSKSENISAADRARFAYIIGDIHRRCGKPELAEKWLRAADCEGARADVKALIPILLKHREQSPDTSSGIYPEIICPLCGRKTEYLPSVEPDMLGGADVDFCGYSLDSSSYGTDVITCLHCLYSRFCTDFQTALDDDNKSKLTIALKAFASLPRPSTPKGFKTWQRFELAAVCMSAIGQKPHKVAMSYINAAWAVRRIAVSATLELDLPMPGPFPSDALKFAKEHYDSTFESAVCAALVLHRAGLNSDRDKYMKKATGMSLQTAERVAALSTFKSLFEREREYLKSAIPHLLTAAVGEDADFYYFLAAESYRRTNSTRSARNQYKKCLQSPRVGDRAKRLLDSL